VSLLERSKSMHRSTDAEKDRAKAEKDRIGVTDGWMYLPFNGGAPVGSPSFYALSHDE